MTFRDTQYPEVVRLANDLAELEERNSHDAISRLILRFAPVRIAEIKKQSNQQPASVAGCT